MYRNILTRTDLQYYLDYFRTNENKKNRFDIIYISCHGWNHSISFEGDDNNIDLKELAEMAKGFFKDRVVHFGSCKTLSNPNEAEAFKEATGARLVCGYEVSVDAMISAIADIALLNELQTTNNIGWIKNKNSKFRKRYESLLGELRFNAY